MTHKHDNADERLRELEAKLKSKDKLVEKYVTDVTEMLSKIDALAKEVRKFKKEWLK